MNAVKVIPQSHVDHGLTAEQLQWLLDQTEGRSSFFIETFTLPAHLGTVECGLVGPALGLPAVPEEDVKYIIRGNRKCASRVLRESVEKPRTRMVTVIAGPTQGHDGLVLYTAYGGPSAPREPGDTTIPNWEGVVESRAFWAEHALIG
jgi:hypothetical protein